jgi:hypothetical protein
MTGFRSLTTFAALAVAALAGMTSPAVASVTAHSGTGHGLSPASSPAELSVIGPGNVPLTCLQPNRAYKVTTTGIHIHSIPNGGSVVSIPKGASFFSDWYFPGSSGEWFCRTTNTYGGHWWVYGYSQSDQEGYVNIIYLQQTYP